jgi:hypothetical protein
MADFSNGRILASFFASIFSSGLPIGNRQRDRAMKSSLLPPYEYEAGLKLGYGIMGSYDAPPPFLSGS